MDSQTPESIQRKGEAKGLMHLIEPTRRQMLVFYNHLHSIGADDHVLVSDDKKKNRMVLGKWFKTLVINNRRFPGDMDIDFVLSEFFEAILQKKVELKGFNLLAHTTAFHEWFDNYENDLRSKWWMKQNPNQRPKAITPRSEDPKEIDTEQMQKSIEALYGRVPSEFKKYLED